MQKNLLLKKVVCVITALSAISSSYAVTLTFLNTSGINIAIRNDPSYSTSPIINIPYLNNNQERVVYLPDNAGQTRLQVRKNPNGPWLHLRPQFGDPSGNTGTLVNQHGTGLIQIDGYDDDPNGDGPEFEGFCMNINHANICLDPVNAVLSQS